MTQMIDLNQKIVSDPKHKRIRVLTINKEPSLTQQQFKSECDINNIMAKYQTTGQFTHTTSKIGRYADFSSIQDYREMLDTVRYAQEAFAILPAEMRKRFDNDPSQLLDFVQDPNNYDEGVKLGLLNPREPKTNQTNEQTQTNDKTQTTPNPLPSNP